MSRDDDFNLISVSSDDDDGEIVIQAGARRSNGFDRSSAAVPNERPQAVEEAPQAAASPASDGEGAEQAGGAGQEPSAEAQEDPLAGLTEEERLEYAKRMARKRQREEESMVTTEADLKAKGPFQGMHTLIVLIGILIVVAGLAWYYLVYSA